MQKDIRKKTATKIILGKTMIFSGALFGVTII